jgi:hypothetical protein
VVLSVMLFAVVSVVLFVVLRATCSGAARGGRGGPDLPVDDRPQLDDVSSHVGRRQTSAACSGGAAVKAKGQKPASCVEQVSAYISQVLPGPVFWASSQSC